MGVQAQVFVANVAWKTSEDAVRLLFEDSGYGISNVKIVMGDDGRSRGFGFVTFTNPKEDVGLVIEKMSGVELEGRKLIVERAKGISVRPGKQ